MQVSTGIPLSIFSLQNCRQELQQNLHLNSTHEESFSSCYIHLHTSLVIWWFCLDSRLIKKISKSFDGLHLILASLVSYFYKWKAYKLLVQCYLAIVSCFSKFAFTSWSNGISLCIKLKPMSPYLNYWNNPTLNDRSMLNNIVFSIM